MPNCLLWHFTTVYTVSTQIQQHSWLEQHLAFFGSKVHFLGQILDYNIQNLNKTASKKLFDLLEQRCSICVDTVTAWTKGLGLLKDMTILFASFFRSISWCDHDIIITTKNQLSSSANIFAKWFVCDCSLVILILATSIYSWTCYYGYDYITYSSSYVWGSQVSLSSLEYREKN